MKEDVRNAKTDMKRRLTSPKTGEMQIRTPCGFHLILSTCVKAENLVTPNTGECAGTRNSSESLK